ncbi:hypothetical protein WMY93_022468 [Mugilogobius chulae]|uniref:Cytidine and dCMP deaminase domain-containing protein 1 n=1 Tax=Mugilogobius chulae TaxID=88201 RepID=A0AAW0NE35_9GOBI
MGFPRTGSNPVRDEFIYAPRFTPPAREKKGSWSGIKPSWMEESELKNRAGPCRAETARTEAFRRTAEDKINTVGLVVVKDSKVVGLHSSGSELHAGPSAILEHGSKLSQSSLYFSRRPCATCLKMIINGTKNTPICFWPGDPEISTLTPPPSSENSTSHDASVLLISEEAALDAVASDKLKSTVALTSASHPVSDASLRSQFDPDHDPVCPDVAVHCMVQARLLSYRTEDPKVGVGAVIWAKRQESGCVPALMGGLYLVGCGFNAYPSGSHFNEFPQMDDKQEDRQRRKYRYIIHAEQNALTFRTHEIRRSDASLLFVTKCPCDECVPLIRAAGVSHIYTSDLDQGRDKGDISYRRFQHLQGVHKYCWQRNPSAGHHTSHYVNGFLGKHKTEPEHRNSKKLRPFPDSNGEEL